MDQAGRPKETRALPALIAVAMLAVCNVAGAQSSGATLIFSYPNGFASASGTIQNASDAGFVGSALSLTRSGSGHEAGAAWYKTPVNITSFTTDFTFQLPSGLSVGSALGITFCVQNTNSTTSAPGYNGTYATGDANMAGYGAYWYPTAGGSQYPLANSVAIKFDMNGANGNTIAYPSSGSPNSTGLYINGGPSAGLVPQNDLNPYGINFYSGHVMAVHIVYDGSLLTLTLQDTATNARAKLSWPVNIPAAVGGNTAWVGFTAGNVVAAGVNANVLTWSFSQGYAPRLAAPSFSIPAGLYTSAQNVSISASPGATIYYTTNGQQPTTSSTQYTGPISVGASEVVQAIAVETGSTDSLVAVANYQIAPAGTPIINFPNGFTNASSLVTVNGTAQFKGSALQLTDTARNVEVGTAWYVAPVNVAAFTTNFTIQLLQPSANGMTFCIQNQPPASAYTYNNAPPTSTDRVVRWASGGPNTMANSQSGLGYSGSTGGGLGSEITGILNSVAVKFDLWTGSGNTTGLYTNGADAAQNSIDMTSSGLSLHSGHPLAVTVNYDGTTLKMTITDTVSKASYSNNWAINIPATVGGSTAYVGFTGGTGGGTAVQDILAWTYSSQGQASQTPPVPMPPTNFVVQ
jgi:hypothetical protein